MATPAHGSAQSAAASSRRKSILDLAPLELDCMNALWPLGEATVREVQSAISAYRPRAYTTIMTILDRLAHKGVVTRRKIGRAYLYRASLLPDVARAAAVDRLVTAFFGGSRQALAQHIGLSAVRQPRPARMQPIAAPTATLAVQPEPNSADAEEGSDSLDETLL